MEKGRTVNTAPDVRKNSIDEKVNSEKKSSKRGGSRPGTGGKRPGAGRKPNKERLIKLGIKEILDKHGLETVEVVETDRATGATRTVPKTRVQALLDVLYNEGHNKRNVPAIKEYYDRVMGRPIQSLQHSGEIAVEEQHVPTKAEKAAARAYLAAMEEEEDSDG